MKTVFFFSTKANRYFQNKTNCQIQIINYFDIETQKVLQILHYRYKNQPIPIYNIETLHSTFVQKYYDLDNFRYVTNTLTKKNCFGVVYNCYQ